MTVIKHQGMVHRHHSNCKLQFRRQAERESIKMSNSVSHSTSGYAHRPYTYTHSVHNRIQPMLTEETNTADFNRYNGDYPHTNPEHAHMPQPHGHRDSADGANDSAQHPLQCLYQHPAPSHSLYPLYQPWQTSLLSGCHDQSPSDGESVINYGRDDFVNTYVHEKSDEPTCLEPLVSPLDQAHSDTGSHSSSTNGSPYMSSTEPPISSHSSSGYGSSSGSTSSSPYPSPSLPDPTPLKQLEADSTTTLSVKPTEDDSSVKPKKARTSYSTEQIRTLENAFGENAYPDYDKLEELAKTLGVTERKVKVWFQNKRARWRKKQAAEPLYNPDVHSAPTPSKLSTAAPTGLSVNTSSGYSAPTKPYPRHATYSTPANYSVPSPYQSLGPLPGLYPPYTPTMCPSHASVPLFRRTNISSDAVPAATPNYPRTKTTAPSTIGYLPSTIPERSGQASLYSASQYQQQYPALQMFSLR